MRYFLIAIVMVGWCFLTPSAEAADLNHCETLKGQRICITQIRRSAARYWEYTAVVTVDGKARPKERFDCRSRVTVEPDGTIFSFRRSEPGAVVCRLYQERSKSLRLMDLKAPKQKGA
jgi:hypothetical protein